MLANGIECLAKDNKNIRIKFPFAGQLCVDFLFIFIMTLLFILYSLSICYITYFISSILLCLNKESKSGLINGTYHLQLSKEELLAHRKAVSIALPILRVTEPEEIYKDIVETLENMAPKFTP